MYRYPKELSGDCERTPPVRGDAAPREGVVQWVRRHLGFEPDARQAAVLSPEIKRGILNCTRQWGKSTMAAAKAVHQAWTVDGSLTVVISPSARQSSELVRKAEGFVRRLGVEPKGDGANEISIALPNGARIVGLPATEATIRGFSAVSLLSKAFDNSDYAEQRFMRSNHQKCLPVATSMRSCSTTLVYR